MQGRALILRLEVVWDVLRDGIINYFKNGALNQAAAIALYALLSIIPLFVLSMLAAGEFLGAFTDVQGQIVKIIKSFHPYFDGDLLNQLGHVETKGQVLGWIGVVSLIWFSSMIFSAIETALNTTFRAESHRNVFVSKLLAFSMIPMGWVVGLTSVLLTYVATLLSNQVFFVEGHFLRLHLFTRFLLQYVVPFLVFVLFTTIVFLVIPARRIRLGTALAGACLFALLVELVKHVFTWYLANYTRYNAIFGSLETVVILVLWVYYMALIFLFCAEIMSSYERRDMLLIEHMLLSRGSKTGRQRLFRKFGRTFPEGSVICREGEHSQEMFFILSGCVRLEMQSASGGKALATLKVGDFFGEMAVLTGAPRTATAIAVSHCELAVIDAGVIHRLLRESDDLSIHLLREFSERIRRTNASLDGLRESWMRLTILLHLLWAWPWPPDQDVPSHIAKATGEDPNTVRAVLEMLAESGLLMIQNESISGFDPERGWAMVRRLLEKASPQS
jgi:YihY family inner membrane protein